MLVGADAAVLNLDEVGQVVVVDRTLIAIERGVDVGEFLRQYEHFLRGERLQTQYRPHQVLHTLRLRKLTLLQSGAQCLVAVDATVAVLDALRRSAHHHTDILRLALQGVVIHRKHLLVVVLP